jgi:hypothetical protein
VPSDPHTSFLQAKDPIDENACRDLVAVGEPWSVEEVDIDPSGPGEVLVRLASSGMCHSDDHAQNGDMHMALRWWAPMRAPGWWRKSVPTSACCAPETR